MTSNSYLFLYGGEILYSVVNSGDEADFLPSKGGSWIVEQELNLITIIGNAANVTAIINDSLFATKKELYDLITFSPTPPSNPTPNSLWIKNLGEASNPPALLSQGGGGVVVANAVFSPTEPEDKSLIWFETEE